MRPRRPFGHQAVWAANVTCVVNGPIDLCETRVQLAGVSGYARILAIARPAYDGGRGVNGRISSCPS